MIVTSGLAYFTALAMLTPVLPLYVKGPLGGTDTMPAAPAVTFAAKGKAAKGVMCEGTNDCKGKGNCKSAAHDCKGKNDCKGQSFTMAKNTKDCEAKGGKASKEKPMKM